MPRSLWRFITNFGDAELLLPLAALLALALWRYASPRAAWLLLRALIVCGAALALLKLAFISCGPRLAWQLQSPSGHTGMSIMVYGALALVAVSAVPPGARRGDALRLAIALAAPIFVAAIAVSRIALRHHSLIEVAVGAGVGVAALSFFMIPYRELRLRPRLPFGVFALATVALVLVTYGLISPAEHFIREASGWLSFKLNICR